MIEKKEDRKAATKAARLLEQYAAEYRDAYFRAFEYPGSSKKTWPTERHKEFYKKIKAVALDLRVSLGPDCD